MDNQNNEIVDVSTNQEQVYSQPQMNNVMPDKPKGKKKGLIIGIIIGVLVVALATFGFILYSSNSKLILSKNITKLYNNLLNASTKNESLKNILNSNEVSVVSNITFNIDDKTNTIGSIGDFKANYKYIENKKDKKGILNFESTLDNEEFINLETAMKDSKVYYKIKNVMDKYYYTDYEFMSMLSNVENKDAEYVLNIIKNSIVNNISKKDLKTSKTEIKVDGKDTKVKKLSLEITDKLISEIINDSIDSIKKDDKAITILSKELEIDKNELKKSLDDAKKSLNAALETSEESEKIVYNMYVKGLNTTVKHEIVIEDVSLQYYDYKDVKEISIVSNNVTFFNLKLENGKISGTAFMMISISGDYSNDKINLNLKSIDNSFEIKMTIENNEEDVTKNKEYKSNVKINISMVENSEEAFNISMSVDSTIKNDEDVKDIDTSNSKNIEEVTDEEQASIQQKLQEIPAIKNIIESTSSIENSQNYGDADDYDYDFDDEYSF